MINLHYKAILNNNVEYVFKNLFSKAIFKQWTQVFNSTSDYTGSFILDEEVLFHDADGNGMLTIISKYDINNIIEFTYVANINMGQKTLFENSDYYERYTFTSNGDQTVTLGIELNIPDEFAEMFRAMWPMAINYIQDLFNND